MESDRSGSPVVLDVRVVRGAGGGPDKTILNSPRFLASAGYRMICAYLYDPGHAGFERLREKARHWQAPLAAIPDRGPLDWRVVSELLALCRRENVAIWHGHDYKSNLLGLLLRRWWPMRLVTTVHGWVEHTARTRLYYWLDRWSLRRYEVVIAVSPDLLDRCLAAGAPPQRCLLVENGIDTDEYHRRRSRTEARRIANVRTGGFLVGAAGRLSPEKGFDRLIQACGQVIKSGIDLELWIAGEGTQRTTLETLARESGCHDRIRFLGYVSDLRPFYEALDLFVLSSIREGLPNVVLEAMAMEVPVLATKVAGVPRLIEDGVTGMLIEPDSVPALVEAIATFQRTPEMGRRLASNAVTKVRDQFSFATRMKRIAHLYDTLLQRRGEKNLDLQCNGSVPNHRLTTPTIEVPL